MTTRRPLGSGPIGDELSPDDDQEQRFEGARLLPVERAAGVRRAVDGHGEEQLPLGRRLLGGGPRGKA